MLIGSNTIAVGWPNPITADNPPYNPVNYAIPYTGTLPLGSTVTINPVTGLISGIAPPSGEYVICVLVKEYRNGINIGESRKELHLNTAPCIPLTANPNFNPVTCDGFTVTFNEASSGNPTTFFWNFGDPLSGTADTSTLQFPTHTFTSAGIFNIKLVVSISGQCIDSVIKPISIFPGFFPGFINSPILCVNQPVQFTDTTRTAYGVVDTWRWDFGDPSTLADTSHLQNPTYTYPSSGTYTVTLIVTNSKGCLNSATSTVTISDPPAVDVFPADTIYCGLDSLQLTATGTGSFNWTPNTNIIGANTATPLVFPTVLTKYFATLTNAAGCSSKDSITVTPKMDLSNTIAGPTPICEEDTITLNGSSNYGTNISWQWSPAATVESPTNSTTRAFPLVTTNYILTTRWGNHCVATANKLITVKPLAIPNAGLSPTICGGQQSAQLNASGGNTYTWSPPTGLNNPNIANPVASPSVTTVYTVSVGVTGCSKTRDDSLIVNVIALPALTLLNDTLICNIDTLQLTTTGTGNYNWAPNYMISNTAISSPLVSPDVPTKYFVTLTDGYGCNGVDSVFVDVKDHVTLFAGNDTTICQTDGFLINTLSDALHYKWIPATYLDYDTLKRPFARPLSTTTYSVVGNIGKCQSNDDIEIKVAPYPAANGGLDTTLCPGFSVQLNATGGSSYLWTPVTFLNNRNIPNPFSTTPSASIRYIVTVTDTLGCPKPVKDTMWVYVYPKVIANAGPRDTSVVIGEPLQLNGGGGFSYLWNPSTWLTNPTIKNPVSLPQDNIQYVVTAISNPGNCIGTDTIDVKVFKIDPDMYVPTAFTPNGDGNNDIFRPILLGMKELKYFRVYNRFGNLLYSTADIGKGWDGSYAGKGQDPATYVWMAEGVTYKGDIKFKKGYVVLIR
jgi:gliding motility-associated-like protein